MITLFSKMLTEEYFSVRCLVKETVVDLVFCFFEGLGTAKRIKEKRINCKTQGFCFDLILLGLGRPNESKNQRINESTNIFQ